MPRSRALGLLGLFAAVAAAGCGQRRVVLPTGSAPALVVLLPDPETGKTGRARVWNEFGAADLTTARAGTRTTALAAPGAVTPISEADVARLFGAALAALPPAPRHFTLRYRFESDVLTDESTALVPEVVRAVKALSVPEVIVIGHTDTMGESRANVALGLRRAMSVRNILVDAGLAPSTVATRSHGEADLLIPTADNTAERRNRRVEITVR
jgi:outer membrane protein OmpA-like peptidoglycan-associated protein